MLSIKQFKRINKKRKKKKKMKKTRVKEFQNPQFRWTISKIPNMAVP